MAPPRRAVPKAPARRELLIFTASDISESYLKYWHRRFRSSVHVQVQRAEGSAGQLIAIAVAEKAAGERSERRGRGRAHDEVWCMLDADGEGELDGSCAAADEHGVRPAVSNPSFDLWLLLHLVDVSGPMSAREAGELLQRHGGDACGLDVEALAVVTRNHATAVARATARAGPRPRQRGSSRQPRERRVAAGRLDSQGRPLSTNCRA